MTGRTNERRNGRTESSRARARATSTVLAGATCDTTVQMQSAPLSASLSPFSGSQSPCAPLLGAQSRRYRRKIGVWRMKLARTRGDGIGEWCIWACWWAPILWRPCRCEIYFEISNWNLNFRMPFLRCRYAVINLDRSRSNSGRLHVNNIFFLY